MRISDWSSDVCSSDLACLETGYLLLLEKPPTVTLGEMAGLAQTASRCSKTLFTTWHAQYNTAVEEARVRIAQDGLSRARITWIEDVRKWHPGDRKSTRLNSSH